MTNETGLFRRTVARLLLCAALFGLVNALAVTPVLAGGKRDAGKTTNDQTRRYAPLAEAVATIMRDNLAAKRKSRNTRAQVLFVWLVDTASITGKNIQATKLAEGLEAVAKAGNAGESRHAVYAFGSAKPAERVLAPTDEIGKVAQALKSLDAKRDDGLKNVCAAIRATAEGIAKERGRKVIVLFTIENGDNEAELEPTLVFLKRKSIRLEVISREAVYSDPYWDGNAAQYAGKVEQTLTGPETPAIELPYGWLFRRVIANDAVPSGFGIYGLARLAVETGGRYFLHYPDVESRTFCQRVGVGCIFCSGTHKHCGTRYPRHTLSLIDPRVPSRAAYGRARLKNKLFRATDQMWKYAFDAELLYSQPPELQAGRTTEGGAANRRAFAGRRNPFAWSNNNWAQLRERALATMNKADTALRSFKRILARADASKYGIRATAVAEITQAQLLLTRYNLVQFVRFCEKVMRELAPNFKPHPLEQRLIPPGYVVAGYYWNNAFFCHGTARMADLELLDTGNDLKGRAEVIERVDQLLAKYKNTPWELVIRRMGIPIFYLYTRGPAVGTPPPKRDREQNKPDKQSTPDAGGTPAQPARPAAPARPGRPGTGTGPAKTGP